MTTFDLITAVERIVYLLFVCSFIENSIRHMISLSNMDLVIVIITYIIKLGIITWDILWLCDIHRKQYGINRQLTLYLPFATKKLSCSIH